MSSFPVMPDLIGHLFIPSGLLVIPSEAKESLNL